MVFVVGYFCSNGEVSLFKQVHVPCSVLFWEKYICVMGIYDGFVILRTMVANFQ